MNCSTVRAALPGLLYGHHDAAFTAQLEAHLAACPACRRERAALQAVRDRLDRLPVPTVQVDVSELYCRAAKQGERSARRWRRSALVAGVAAAAVALLSFSTRFQMRVEAHQLTVRWGQPAEADVVPPSPVPQAIVSGPVPLSEERLRLLSDLIHALASDVDSRDRRQQEELARVQERLSYLQRGANARLLTLERRLDNLNGVQVTLSQKGANP